ncbi:MAG: phenylacetate-CoA ligase [Desulfovibrionales bacterium]|nr:phenylacetate-CoA ligase [Desulfovibrionales bacterium]
MRSSVNSEKIFFTADILSEIECRSLADVLCSSFDLLMQQLRYALKNSLFYQKKFKTIDFRTKNFSLDAFRSLPFTEKSELLVDQEAFPPFGSNLCVDLASVVRVHKTSGTTGRPLIIALTDEDLRWTKLAGGRCFYSAGLRSSDLVFHCLNFCMWAGGLTDCLSLENVGASVVPFGVGNSKNLIEMMLLLKPSAIHCTPSYLSKLEQLLHEDYSLKPEQLGLKLGLFGAEGGLEDAHYRSKIEQTWGIRAINANYGMADVLATFGAECSQRDGLHFMGQHILYPELIDPQRMTPRPIVEGAVGELVLTNLCKQAQPLIRYRTRDIIEVIATGPCSCGRGGMRFRILGRSDDMFVVKGVNVFPSTVSHVIRSMPDVLSGEYQIYIDKNQPIKKMLIKLELSAGVQLVESLQQRVTTALASKLSFHPAIEFLPAGSLPRTAEKTKHVFKLLD